MKILNSQIVIYKDQNGHVKIVVRFDGDTVWLTQDTIATLYNKGRSTVTEHIQNIFQEGELDENSVCREFRRTGADGKEYLVKYYNLDLIIAVG
ncbi:MAG: cell filamentation protein Fic, partial [bacterium]|nr:cell filamentation protein Fic [bacterium]